MRAMSGRRGPRLDDVTDLVFIVLTVVCFTVVAVIGRAVDKL